METHFAPAGRETPEQLARRVETVRRTPLLQHMMDALPTPVVILNEQRQIVAANKPLLRMMDVRPETIVGRRTGEVLGCVYSLEGPDGCGTTRHCLTCGAVAAVLDSQRSKETATRECRMSLDTAIDGGARDLRVTAAAVTVEDQRFSVCTIEDISQQKRLSVLSRVFFHDVLNTAGGIRGFLHLLADEMPSDSRTVQDVRQLEHLAEQLVSEIESQRDLTLAESGDLAVNPLPVHTVELVEELRSLYAGHTVAEGRGIRVAEVWDGRLITDPRLVTRVLGNMVKNALEATPAGGTVTISCASEGRHIMFSVHNPSVMPEEVQLQVFHRSFSTKATKGRGIGTYSMRLFGEHYLGGKVSFTSREPEGTVFVLSLPRVMSLAGLPPAP